MQHHPFAPSSHRASAPFELLYVELRGLLEKLSTFRHKYIIGIVDDYTRFAWVYFFKEKSHANAMLQDFFAYAKRQHGANVKRVRSDHGGAFLAKRLTSWFETLGVILSLSCGYCHV